MHLINKLEKIQRNFLHFYAYTTKLFNHNTDVIANFTNLKSLKTRKLVFDASFINC
jgi:hypothetical protein